MVSVYHSRIDANGKGLTLLGHLSPGEVSETPVENDTVPVLGCPEMSGMPFAGGGGGNGKGGKEKKRSQDGRPGV
jgi:hypothetical protein